LLLRRTAEQTRIHPQKQILRYTLPYQSILYKVLRRGTSIATNDAGL